MRNKIVLVPFPFDNLKTVKVRPALCLSEAISPYQHLVIAFITSRIEIASEASDLLILESDPDFEQTGLIKDSAIRFHRLVTIPTHMIRRELGYLPESYQKQLKEKLKNLLDL